MSKINDLELLLKQGEITRRGFLTQVSALGLTAALSPTLLTTLARAETPKKGGRLRIGVIGFSTTDSWDPQIMTNIMQGLVANELRNNLTEVDHNFQAIPELAESWEWTLEGKKWIFKLRKGVEFHNGKTMDAEDVIFSLNLHKGKESKSPAKILLEPVKEIKADGKYTVVFTLEEGYADFPYVLSDPRLQIVPMGTTNFDDGIGTGGYILVRHEPGIRTLVKRNPNYWKKGRAHFDEVENICILDVVARTNALTTGQVDVIYRPDLKTVDLLEKIPGIQVVENTGSLHYALPMRTDIPPYNDNDVRLGLKYAVDRNHLLKAILRGHGTIGNDNPISLQNRYHASASELPQIEYDPDKARYYMKKAGQENHVFKLHPSDGAFSGCVDLAVLYKEHAAKAGIKIEVVREPDDTYWTEVWKKKEWTFNYWYGRPTEDWMFSSAYAAGAAWNESSWNNERFNKLLKEARVQLDEAKRREMYVEMQRIVHNEGGTVIPLFPNYLLAATTKLKFEKPVAGNVEFDGRKLPERWWFES